MESGMFSGARSSGLVVWVAIGVCDVTSFIKKFEQALCNASGSLPTIFAHPDECGPVPGADGRKKDERTDLELPVRGDESVEIGQLCVERVANPFEAVERDASHGRHAGHGGGFHIDQTCTV